MGPYHKDECDQCGLAMGSWAEHQEHIQNAHANVWMYKCGICEELFNDKTERGSHRRTHTSDNEGENSNEI